MTNRALEDAYQWCQSQVSAHYENFPVASILLPKRLRRPVAAIYAFARRADDIVDEGKDTPEQRTHNIQAMQDSLLSIINHVAQQDKLFIALADTINQHQLSISLFQDLLSAFSQDINTHRYANYAQVLDYCQRSANPIGRLMLHLHRQATAENIQQSDAICSALQLINFMQDIHDDLLSRDRIYLPSEDMQRYQITEEMIHQRQNGVAMQQLLTLQYDRIQYLLDQGRPLLNKLKGRFGMEIRLIFAGGERILAHLKASQTSLFSRPRLTSRDWLRMIWHAITH